MRLGINTGFALNRYPMPKQWLEAVGQELGLRYAQLTADLINPDLGDKILGQLVKEINSYRKDYGVTIDSVMTGTFTRVNHFSHPDKGTREHWKKWFRKLVDISVDIGADNLSSHFGIICYEDLKDDNKRKLRLEETVNSWKELAEYAKIKGMDYLSWEPMCIAREYGNTIEDTWKIDNMLKGSALPIYICLDINHINPSSSNPEDADYKAWLRNFASISPIMHIKQFKEGESGNYPFLKKYNEAGVVKPSEFIEALKESSYIKDSLILFEVSFKEREPQDSLLLEHLKESVEYWKPWIK